MARKTANGNLAGTQERKRGVATLNARTRQRQNQTT